MIKLCGIHDKNLSIIRDKLKVSISIAENSLVIYGDDENVLKAKKVILSLLNFVTQDEFIDTERVFYAIENIDEKADINLEGFKAVVAIDEKGNQIKCKTAGQLKYLRSLENKTVTIGVGPAGTGKTFLAVAYASRLFKNRKIDKIILTRPAVEAGEKLGFLPGDLQEKVDPYLRPLYDALSQMFGEEQYKKLVERGAIEVAPLAYMRGRTLANAYIILDEAQNTTVEQMKMFLTRLGENSRMVVNGDLTQVDLPFGTVAGLEHACSILGDIKEVGIVRLGLRDVVRNSLVAEILQAYEKSESKAAEFIKASAKNKVKKTKEGEDDEE